MTTNLQIAFGALAKPFLEQLAPAGITDLHAKDCEQLDLQAKAITRLHLSSIITTSERDKAEKRLMKKINALIQTCSKNEG